MSEPRDNPTGNAVSGRFATTQWSLIRAASDRESPGYRDSLAEFYSTYWQPVYFFIRRRGHPEHEAQDLTQDFFLLLVKKDWLGQVGEEGGRFRSFLLVCVKRFLANEHERLGALKRGGGRRALSLDFDDAERRYNLEPSHSMTADRLFERQWAVELLKCVLARLESEFRSGCKELQFITLKVYLACEAKAPPYAEVAASLGSTEGAVKVAVHRLRQRYRQTLREEIARTVEDPAEVDEEINRLLMILAS